MELEQVILNLIDDGKEGDYWDFKQSHHEKTGHLIKDIICLANTVRHAGDRYIIFGVTNDAKIIGIDSTGRRTQADIINILSQAGFAGNVYPDIYLKEIVVDNKKLDVLIIKDAPEKPYYLQKEFKNGEIRINPGTIYTRIRDSNTPVDQVAPGSDIEKMWRERFGLSQTPLDRVKKYLKDYQGWKSENNTSYYESAPEFTIRESNTDQHFDFQQEWTRGEIGSHYASGNAATVFEIRYHQTVLTQVDTVSFDGGKKSIVAPDWKPFGNGRIYFYLMDSITYAFQQYWRAIRGGADHSQNLNKTDSLGHFEIPVFRDETDLLNFFSYSRPVKSSSPNRDEAMQNAIFYDAVEQYERYREQSQVPIKI